MNTITQIDWIEGLKQLESNSIDCCVTSPPYWGLRDYGVEGQLGQEKTPEEYISKLAAGFNEVKRVLRDAGTLWLNLGDSYARTGGADINISKTGKAGNTIKTLELMPNRKQKTPDNLKQKDLIGIPWMAAFALRSAGWYLRQDIIWSKPNGMPESVTDRCTKSHEYLFLLSKSERYHFDYKSIRTPLKSSSVARYSQDVENQSGSLRVPGKTNGAMKAVRSVDKQRGHARRHAGFNDRWDNMTKEEQQANGANKRSVWTVSPQPFSDAHFATFPPMLIIDCIKAGCPEGGIVLDPFMGAGTTAVVAKKLNRNFIGFELNPEYIKIAEKRLRKEIGMFL